MTKQELRQLADRLRDGDRGALDACLAFFELETRGHWHNRARAMMARRLKHIPLRPEQRERLLRVILARLAAGTFTEQFKDQIRLAVTLDRPRVVAAARASASSPRAHVRRYAAWILAHHSGESPRA